MKQLLLMRHGKSDWNKLGQEDFERPLAKRGKKATLRVAAWIEQHDLRPNIALVSKARRTQETWELAQGVLGPVEATNNLEELYLASPGEILAQLAAVDDAYIRTIVIGHNPGMESLSHLLAGPGTNSSALEDLRRGFPTAALAVFDLDGDSWSSLNTDGARLTEFVRPRDLE
jgi:phosphohistidine phosphatase